MTKTFNQVEIGSNPEFQQALALMEDTGQNLLITGRAGTGKSILLNYFRDHTKKNVVVLAPTGGRTVVRDFKNVLQTLSDEALLAELDSVINRHIKS